MAKKLRPQNPSKVTSLQNPRVKQAVKLRDRRDRDRDQLFVIEGFRGLLRAFENEFPVEEIFFNPGMFQGQNEMPLLARFEQRGTRLTEVSAAAFRKMAYRDRPEGLLGVAGQVHRTLADITLGENPLLLVAEAIEKPGNLGTMLRTADATGVDAFLLCDACTDLFNPNVVRASTGTLFSVPLAESASGKAITWMKRRGVQIVAATPHTDTRYTDIDMTRPTAVVVGTEQYGLSTVWLDQADCRVRIPMLGTADSLNVASATTLLLYEAVRQRRLG